MNLTDIKKHASSRDAEQGNKGIKYFIYENLSTWLVNILVHTPITANQITILGILFPFGSMLLFAYGNMWMGLLGVLFLYLGELMDACDGTLARTKKQCSKLQSNFLGNLYHSLSYPFLFIGIGVGVYMNTGNAKYLIVGGLAGMFQMTVAFTRFLSSSVLLKNGHGFDSEEKQIMKQSIVKKLFEAPMKHLRLIILFCVLLGLMKHFIIFYLAFNYIKMMAYISTIYLSFKNMENN